MAEKASASMDLTSEQPAPEQERSDPIRAFLEAKGKVPAGDAGERDDRIYNAAMSCVELSLRPYDRRLLNRALHDADRLETMLGERPLDGAVVPSQEMFTPSEFREFLTLVEREVQKPGSEGPVPALYRTGAHLIAASYLWDRGEHGGYFRQIVSDSRASLKLLDDLLVWVDSGKRGDRMETLQEAQERLDSVDKRVEDQFSTLQTQLSELTRTVASLGQDDRSDAAELGAVVAAVRHELSQVKANVDHLAAAAGDSSRLDQLGSNVDAKLAEISNSVAQLSGRQNDMVASLNARAHDESKVEDTDVLAAVDELRTLMLGALIGIAVVGILVIIAISVT